MKLIYVSYRVNTRNHYIIYMRKALYKVSIFVLIYKREFVYDYVKFREELWTFQESKWHLLCGNGTKILYKFHIINTCITFSLNFVITTTCLKRIRCLKWWSINIFLENRSNMISINGSKISVCNKKDESILLVI